MKKNLFYRVTTDDLLLDKGTQFWKDQFPNINLHLIFSIGIKVNFKSLLTASLLIMERLWEAIDPDLPQTVTFFPLNSKTKETYK